MKYLNFISTLSCEQQYEIRRWFFFTIISISVLLATICFFMIPQFVDLYRQRERIVFLRNAVQNYSEVQTRQIMLQKENDLINARQKKMNRYMNNPKGPGSCFLFVFNLCKNDIELERIAKNKKEYDIIFLCSTIERATELIRDLSEFQEFSSVKLNSVEHDVQRNHFRCVVKALWS